MGHDARDQRARPRPTRPRRRRASRRCCGRTGRGRTGRWRSRTRRRWRRPCTMLAGDDQPRPEPADHDHDHGHQRQPARAVQRDERPHEQERDRVVDQVRREVRVQERRGEDRPQVADVPRVDPAPAVQSLAVERVDPLDEPHERDDPDQQTEPLDRLARASGGYCCGIAAHSMPRGGAAHAAFLPRLLRADARFGRRRAARGRSPAPPRPARQRLAQRELAGRVRPAAARAQPVDRQRDRGREVAGVARRRPAARRRSACPSRRDAPASSGAVAAIESIPGHSRSIRASSVTSSSSAGTARQHRRERLQRPRRACRRSARRPPARC